MIKKTALNKILYASLGPVLATVLAFSSQVSADDTADFYSGNTVNIIVPYNTGGGFDRITRSVARQMEKHTDAKFIVQNVPGANGLIGANQLYNASPDGLTIGLLPGTTLILAAMEDISGIAYDFPKYSFIGRVTAEEKVMFVRPDSEYENFDDIVNSDKPVRFGEIGGSTDTFVFLVGLKHAMGLPIEIVPGYEGFHQIELAVMNGELDAGFAAVGSRYPRIRSGDLKGVAIFGAANPPMPEYENLPLLPAGHELEPGGEKILDSIMAMNEAHRVVAAPPGLPAARRAFLEDALKKSLQDPDLIEQWRKEAREVSFLSGEEYQKVAERIFSDTPERLLEAWREEKSKIKY